MDFGDIVISSILSFLILFLIIVNSSHIVTLENKIEILENYHSNVCSVCGQALNN